jgi:hypothetical protein
MAYVDRSKVTAAFLRKFAQQAAERSDARAAAVQVKRAAPKPVVPEVPEVPDFSVVGEPKRRKVNTVDVERWWRAAMGATFGVRAKHAAWGPKERALAKQLLLLYGAEAVERGLAEWIAAWPEHPAVVAGRLPALPTVALVWAMRQEVWSVDVAGVEHNATGGLAKSSRGATLSERDRKRAERAAAGEYNPREQDPAKRKGSGW